MRGVKFVTALLPDLCVTKVLKHALKQISMRHILLFHPSVESPLEMPRTRLSSLSCCTFKACHELCYCMYKVHMIFQSLLLSIWISLLQAILTYLTDSIFCVIVSLPGLVLA